jgi:hypothetical protein
MLRIVVFFYELLFSKVAMLWLEFGDGFLCYELEIVLRIIVFFKELIFSKVATLCDFLSTLIMGWRR